MKLLLKFNLIFIIVMALGVAVSGWISRSMLQEQAQQEVLGGARLLMEQASAVRAVGGAVGRNPISIIVPCHRVLGAKGSLTGYAGGLVRKIALLGLESPP